MYKGVRYTRRIGEHAQACLREVPPKYLVQSLQCTIDGQTDEPLRLVHALEIALALVYVSWHFDLEHQVEEAIRYLKEEAIERALRSS